MRYLVTGCGGFIGSHLTDRLIQQSHEVVGYDNFSTGFHEFLSEAKKSKNFTLIEADLLDTTTLTKAMNHCDGVFHFAANADIRFGLNHPYKDLEQNALATYHVLEAMRANHIKHIVFSSTSALYGEPEVFPTPENVALPTQTSLYGASKLAAEGLIQSYCEGFDFKSHIFRFVSIAGPRYTHGHVFDFCKQLFKDPQKLHVLGNGKQRKSYLHVEDCIDAIFHAIEKATAKINIFNLGQDNFCLVNDSVGWICQTLDAKPDISYAGGDRGWVGDNPFTFLDCKKIRQLGWNPKHSIQDSIMSTAKFLQDNLWVIDKR